MHPWRIHMNHINVSYMIHMNNMNVPYVWHVSLARSECLFMCCTIFLLTKTKYLCSYSVFFFPDWSSNGETSIAVVSSDVCFVQGRACAWERERAVRACKTKRERVCVSYCLFVCVRVRVCACARARMFNLISQSRSTWSLFNGTWQKRRTELDNRLSFEIQEMTLHMQEVVRSLADYVPQYII